jgi:hypothetical protein
VFEQKLGQQPYATPTMAMSPSIHVPSHKANVHVPRRPEYCCSSWPLEVTTNTCSYLCGTPAPKTRKEEDKMDTCVLPGLSF